MNKNFLFVYLTTSRLIRIYNFELLEFWTFIGILKKSSDFDHKQTWTIFYAQDDIVWNLFIKIDFSVCLP